MSIFLICLNYLSYISGPLEILYYLNKKFLLLELSPNLVSRFIYVFCDLSHKIKPI